MKIYVINLATAQERRRRTEQLLQQLGLDYEIFTAIDGRRDLDFKDIAAYKAKSRYLYCKYDWMRCVNLNEFACNFSHAAVLEKIAHGDAKYGVILEDDIRISSKAQYFLSDDSWIKQDFDIIKLDTGCKKVFLSKKYPLDFGYNLYHLKSSNYMASGYIISKQAARLLYPVLKYTDIMVDSLYYGFEGGLAKQLHIGQIFPAIIDMDSSFTSIIDHPKKNVPFAQKSIFNCHKVRNKFLACLAARSFCPKKIIFAE